MVFCGVMLCSLVDWCQYFKETCCLRYYTLKAKMADSSEKLVPVYQSTWYRTLEDHHENLKSNFSILALLQKELAEKRVALSVLLMDLLSQQAERRQQLLNTLTEMEKRRWIDEEVCAFSFIIIWFVPCIVLFMYKIYLF